MTASTEEHEARLDPAILRVMAVVLLGPFMAQIDSTVVNVSLSAIRDDLRSSTESAQWIVSAYLLALARMLCNPSTSHVAQGIALGAAA